MENEPKNVRNIEKTEEKIVKKVDIKCYFGYNYVNSLRIKEFINV